MKPKTQELLYFFLWACDKLCRPTWRSIDESFEQWAYRNGLQRQINVLEKQKLLERNGTEHKASARLLRLTQQGRIEALGGRDPEACWNRVWDGQWRLVLFDVPVKDDSVRDRLRKYLRHRGFGYLQRSVWVTPHALNEEKAILSAQDVDVASLLFLEARPCAGETDEEIVREGWNFQEINRLYNKVLEVLEDRPVAKLRTDTNAREFRTWANQERSAWLAAVTKDPLLPKSLHPEGYLGAKAWHTRIKVLRQAAEQIKDFTSTEK